VSRCSARSRGFKNGDVSLDKPNPFGGAAGLLLLAFGIWKGAWVGIVLGLALIGVDVFINWAERPAKRG
jgi:hypothetical protein